MITRAMRAALAARGYTPQQIGELTPVKALEILGGAAKWKAMMQ
jgi:hypothetical protein